MSKDLRREIDNTGTKNVDFICDSCDQTYFEQENVKSEDIYFGKKKSNTEIVRETAKKQHKKIAYGGTGNMQVLGYPVDEIKAILIAIEDLDTVNIETHRRVVRAVGGDAHPINIDTEEVHSMSYAENNDVVAAEIKSKPPEDNREPDSVICEYCKQKLQDEN